MEQLTGSEGGEAQLKNTNQYQYQHHLHITTPSCKETPIYAIKVANSTHAELLT
jgi:hypothetical protein